MVQVPYTPYPSVSPTDAGTPALRIPTPGAAFGETVARAIESVGGSVEQGANEIFHRAVALQQVRNKAEADEADANYMEAVGKLHADYSSLRGQAAVDGYDAHVRALRQAREQFRAKLSNDDARRIYDSSSRGFLARNIFNAAGHSATEQKTWAKDSSEARISAIYDDAWAHPEMPIEHYLDQIQDEVENTLAPIAGWSDDKLDEEVKSRQGNLLMLKIESLARTDPAGAKKLLDQYVAQESMTEKQMQHADMVVKNQTHQTYARIVADKYKASDPDSNIEDVVKKVTDDIRQQFPDDPAAVTYGVSQARGQHATANAIRNERRDINMNLIWDTMVKGGQGGKVPLTLEDLYRIDPRTQQAFENLDGRGKRTVTNVLMNNIKGDVVYTPERQQRYQELLGEAFDSPSKFIENHDVADLLDEDLPRKLKDHLIGVWRKARAGQELDPSVNRAFQYARDNFSAELMGLRILKSDNNPALPSATNRFRGVLSDAIDVWRQEHEGKAPTNKDYKDVIIPDILHKEAVAAQGGWIYPGLEAAGRWFGLDLRSQYNLMDRPMPDSWANARRNEIQTRTGRMPTDEQLRRDFIRQTLIELWGSRAVSKP